MESVNIYQMSCMAGVAQAMGHGGSLRNESVRMKKKKKKKNLNSGRPEFESQPVYLLLINYLLELQIPHL